MRLLHENQCPRLTHIAWCETWDITIGGRRWGVKVPFKDTGAAVTNKAEPQAVCQTATHPEGGT